MLNGKINMVTMFAKLYSRITESSLMEQTIEVRYTFLMLLAISDPTGRVVGTDIAIARRLNMSVECFVKSVKQLGEPDEDSNSKEEEGRRVLPSDGERGYQLVNFLKYRNLKDEDEKREYMREYMKKRRADTAAVKSVKLGKGLLTDVTQAEAEAKVEAEEEQPPFPPQSGGVELPENLRTPEFVEAWNKWIKYRKEIRHKLAPSTIASQLKMLSGIGSDRAVKMIEHTITKGWQGLKEPDAPFRSQNGKPPAPASTWGPLESKSL